MSIKRGARIRANRLDDLEGDFPPMALQPGSSYLLFARFLRPIRRKLAWAAALQVIVAITTVAPPVAIAEFARHLLAGGSPTGAWWVAAVTATALLVRAVCTVGVTVLTNVADNDMQRDLRVRMAEHLTRLPLDWFGGRGSGRVRKAVTDDVASLHRVVAQSLMDALGALLVPTLSLAYMLWVSPAMTGIVLLPVLVGSVFYKKVTDIANAGMAGYHEAVARLSAAAVEFVQGIAVVKVFGRTDGQHGRWRAATGAFSSYLDGWSRSVDRPMVAGTVAYSAPVAMATALAGGGVLIWLGVLAPADVVPYLLLAPGLAAPLLALGYAAQDIQFARTALDEIGGVLDAPARTEPPPGAVPRGNEIVFADVRFGYGEQEVLRGIDLTLTPGTVTALVGPSGAGKSTLAALLARLHEGARGTISIGGVDLGELPDAELYRRIGFVLQDVRLLRASVRDNIALARPGASDEEVQAAARAARVHDRVMELPRGYDSVVGEDAAFSGGEAQRVSIARALIADTPVLVLDEATAFADPESELAVQEALSHLMRGRTLLVIAHRLHTVQFADQIVVLDGGRVAERGTHDDLLAAGGLYARLWAAQEQAVAA
ncbi:ABC transporter ATP-binding protein [Nonomuraea sp. NPDC059194]|uniref:ABC transporter ATP-binding protein n=1 Tax=Nonomuraea sp. NPDC059194 TaxID=3346764 RepID=UPI0036B17114